MAKRKRKNKQNNIYLTLFVVAVVTIFNIYQNHLKEASASLKKESAISSYTLQNLPSYNGEEFVILNQNIPLFEESDYSNKEFENYSELDNLGRVGVAFANVGIDLMPTEKRGSIGMIKPSGWHTVKYDIVDGKYLYNRCHLIGYQLTGENANEKNLMTCTRQMNMKGMLSFENQVSEYIKETKNHVLYRVTPIYEKDNLLANGVVIEASSVEDKGFGLQFHVYVYNVQDGIEIDYKTGNSKLKTELEN